MSTLWSDSHQTVTSVPGDKHVQSAKTYFHKFIKISVLNINIAVTYWKEESNTDTDYNVGALGITFLHNKLDILTNPLNHSYASLP